MTNLFRLLGAVAVVSLSLSCGHRDAVETRELIACSRTAHIEHIEPRNIDMLALGEVGYVDHLLSFKGRVYINSIATYTQNGAAYRTTLIKRTRDGLIVDCSSEIEMDEHPDEDDWISRQVPIVGVFNSKQDAKLETK